MLLYSTQPALICTFKVVKLSRPSRFFFLAVFDCRPGLFFAFDLSESPISLQILLLWRVLMKDGSNAGRLGELCSASEE
jgi:hypothetical protein